MSPLPRANRSLLQQKVNELKHLLRYTSSLQERQRLIAELNLCRQGLMAELELRQPYSSNPVSV